MNYVKNIILVIIRVFKTRTVTASNKK